jgi:hypothetical protein
VVVNNINREYLRTIIAVTFSLINVNNLTMTDPSRVPPYPELSNPTIGVAWPMTGQVQYVQQPYTQPGGPVHIIHQVYRDPSIAQIRDWLPWSIVNMFIGWIIGGILPLIFSVVCRSYKSSNNASGARTMGTLALVFNILVTLAGVGGWIALIVTLAIAGSAVSTFCTFSYPYCR